MSNESKTMELVRNKFKELGYKNIMEQTSENPKIQNLLKNASKSGKGVGRPDFIIETEKLLIIVECKANTKFQISSDYILNPNTKDYAVDGALWYASHLKEKFDVIAIGASGETIEELEINNYFFTKHNKSFDVITDEYNKPINRILSESDYLSNISRNPIIEKKRLEDLMKYSRELHSYIHSKTGIEDKHKPLLVSAIMLALQNPDFVYAYKKKTPKRIATFMLNSIKEFLEDSKIPEDKRIKMLSQFQFIKEETTLNNKVLDDVKTPLQEIIKDFHDEVMPFLNDYKNYDALGHFYGEFLKYSDSDASSLGIVLTPKHITELFTELVDITTETKVLDTCTGTGGFLIAAMDKMFKLSNGNEEIKEKIRKDNLIGIELQNKMFTLAATNMIFRGDGKSNLYQGSCFDKDIQESVKEKNPDCALINPPYSQKGNLSEVHFIYETLNMLKKGGKLVAIVPMSVAIKGHPLKKKLLEEHRLDAVMTMPETLFQGYANVSTCIMVLTAKVPHKDDKYFETWFGYWKDDGFVKTRNNGRQDINKVWYGLNGQEGRKDSWLRMFKNKDVIKGISVRKTVDEKDEWCAEAYMETDFSNLKEVDFITEMKSFSAFKLLADLSSNVSNDEVSKNDVENLSIEEWKDYKWDDLFFIENPKNEKIDSDEITPYIGASKYNNGITDYLEICAEYRGNKITVGSNGQSGVCQTFYQPINFSANTTVKVLDLKNGNLNPYIAMFLIPIIKKEKFKYSFGRSFSVSKMKDSKIKLPSKFNDSINEYEPDWEYMEKYIKTSPYSSSL